MFTIDQITEAHRKVTTGADFPAYIREIKQLGVVQYTTFVSDGHTDYQGNDQPAHAPAKYAPLSVAPHVQSDRFRIELLAHQQGKSDFMTFIKMCADCGIDKWVVRTDEMTCTYYDKQGHGILTETIPA